MSETAAGRARRSLERLGLPGPWRLPQPFADGVERYVALLLEANARVNLTRIVEPEAVARLHLLDALAALPLIDEVAARRAIDLGSGGGVPGIVLALARPEVSWMLVDSVGKKADALRSFVSDLDLDNVSVLAERAETIGRREGHRAAYDLVTARACAALPVLVEYALPLLRVGGSLIAWKGVMDSAELASGLAAAAQLGGAEPEVRPTGRDELGEHRFVVVTKLRPTEPGFPRRAGEARRRPLGA